MVNSQSFSQFTRRKRIGLYTLRNPRGMQVQITNYGAKIVSLLAPDADGKMAMTNLVFPSEPYNKLTIKGKAKAKIYAIKQ